MRHLGSAALSQHLAVLGQVLINLPSEGVGPPLPPLKTFFHLAVGQDVDDVEEAYRFAHTLDAPLRARVEGGLSRATTLTLTDEVDKARFGREVPLSQEARDALDAICPE